MRIGCLPGFGTKKPMNPSGQEIVEIEATLPYPLYVGDGEKFEVATAVGSVPVEFVRVRRDPPDPRIQISKTNMDLGEDRTGLLSYSVASIKMTFAQFSEFRERYGTQEEIHIIRLASIDILNRFIRKFRLEAGDYWIRPLSLSSLLSLEIRFVGIKGVSRVIHDSNVPGGLQLPVIGLTKEANGRLQASLSDYGPPPLWDEFVADAKDELDLGDLNSALLKTHAAIEHLARNCLISWMYAEDNTVESLQSLGDRRGFSSGQSANPSLWLSRMEWVDYLPSDVVVALTTYEVLGQPEASSSQDFVLTFDHIDADRDDLLHNGTVPMESNVHEYLELAERFVLEVKSNAIFHRLGSQPKDEFSKGLEVRLGSAPPDRLIKAALEIAQVRPIGLMATNRYPYKQRKNPHSTTAIIEDNRRLRIYVPRSDSRPEYDWSLDLVRLLESRLIRLGKPRAVAASRTSLGGLGINLAAYRELASDVSDTVVGVAVDAELKASGFNLEQRSKTLADNYLKEVDRGAVTNVSPPDLAFADFVLRGVEMHVGSESEFERLVSGVVVVNPRLAEQMSATVERISYLDLTSSSDWPAALLLLKESVGVLDTIGVIGGDEPQFRSRMSDSELTKLRLK